MIKRLKFTKKTRYYSKECMGILLFISLIILSGCSRKTDNTIGYSNAIFSQNIYDKITEIDYWIGDQKVVINGKDDIQTIYSSLASLILTEKSIKNNARKESHIMIEIVTHNETISMGLLSDELVINNITYSVNKEVLNTIREIALKYNN